MRRFFKSLVLLLILFFSAQILFSSSFAAVTGGEHDGLILEVDFDEPDGDLLRIPFDFDDDSEFDYLDKVEGFPVDKELDVVQGFWDLWQAEREKVFSLEEKLQPLSLEILSLTGQLQLLELQSENFVNQVELLKNERLKTQDDLEKLKVQLKLKRLDLKEEIQRMSEIVNLLYLVKRSYIEQDGKINVYRLFFQNGKASDVLFKEKLLQQIQGNAVYLLRNSLEQFSYLKYLNKSLSTKKEKMEVLFSQIEKVEQSLFEQKQYQQRLVSEKGNEKDFIESRIEDARRQQQKAYDKIQEIAARLRDYESEDQLVPPREKMIWPVTPSQSLSTEFRDVEYKKRFGIEHNAIDIPVPHYSPIYAALSGRVEIVHDAGMGYNYLQLIHEDGLSTVYGHIAEFRVSEGDFVYQGDIVALSGGTPGTRGSGVLTTGPHLHFEVLVNGNWKDPEKYLPRR